MAQTDRQTDKSSRWAFTAYEEQWSLFEIMPPGIAEWGWNAEVCPKTNRKHYQGYLRLSQQQRFAWLRKLLPGVHLEISRNWDALKLYCRKDETRIPGTEPVARTNSFMTIYQYTPDVAKRIAEQIKISDLNIDEIPKPQLLMYVDTVVREDIRNGRLYASDIAVNPQWISKWNKFGREIIFSFININATPSDQTSPAQSSETQGEQTFPCSQSYEDADEDV